VICCRRHHDEPQIIDGRNDDLVPGRNNQYLDDLLPKSEIHTLDAGSLRVEQAGPPLRNTGKPVVDWGMGGYDASGGLTAVG